ncbi:NUDIX hydrolase [Streptomyces sp. NRRL F-2580]|uniref:NUDIX hydrolase n=1 Tax=Streptomyces sp. NRRL F-2580 TaxID=1463841 RepID=UPI0004C6B8AF|nr:NUDIX hydrolase [Streptomyces sp. NRRL F-2580]
MTETTEQQGISAAIIVDAGLVLMIRRRVAEGELMWQFPAGGIADGETAEQAAVRETLEETGLTVEAIKLLGERVHPKTGRLVSYTACEMINGYAIVGDTDEIAEVAWVTHSDLPTYVPYGLFEPVQAYLDGALPA